MFCPNCGSQVSEGERFCSKCGNALEGTKTGNKENTGYSAGIAEAMGNPGAMAGKKPAEKGKKGRFALYGGGFWRRRESWFSLQS